MERDGLKSKIALNRIVKKLKSNSGEAGFKSVFILFIGMVVVAMVFNIFVVIAVSFSARDTLDRAVLNSATASMESSEVYVYLRNGGNNNISTAPRNTILEIFEDNLKETLKNDLGLESSSANATGKYSNGAYSIDIKNCNFNSSDNVFTVEGEVTIPINFMGVPDITIAITSKAGYKSISQQQ